MIMTTLILCDRKLLNWRLSCSDSDRWLGPMMEHLIIWASRFLCPLCSSQPQLRPKCKYLVPKRTASRRSLVSLQPRIPARNKSTSSSPRRKRLPAKGRKPPLILLFWKHSWIHWFVPAIISRKPWWPWWWWCIGWWWFWERLISCLGWSKSSSFCFWLMLCPPRSSFFYFLCFLSSSNRVFCHSSLNATSVISLSQSPADGPSSSPGSSFPSAHHPSRSAIAVSTISATAENMVTKDVRPIQSDFSSITRAIVPRRLSESFVAGLEGKSEKSGLSPPANRGEERGGSGRRVSCHVTSASSLLPSTTGASGAAEDDTSYAQAIKNSMSNLSNGFSSSCEEEVTSSQTFTPLSSYPSIKCDIVEYFWSRSAADDGPFLWSWSRCHHHLVPRDLVTIVCYCYIQAFSYIWLLYTEYSWRSF